MEGPEKCSPTRLSIRDCHGNVLPIVLQKRKQTYREGNRLERHGEFCHHCSGDAVRSTPSRLSIASSSFLLGLNVILSCFGSWALSESPLDTTAAPGLRTSKAEIRPIPAGAKRPSLLCRKLWTLQIQIGSPGGTSAAPRARDGRLPGRGGWGSTPSPPAAVNRRRPPGGFSCKPGAGLHQASP